MFTQTSIIFSQVETGIAFYKEKKFDQSLPAFLEVVQAGGQGEDLYYNMGNVYFQLQKYPEAILFYKKALRWNPTCKECLTNLAMANQAAGIDDYKVPEFFLSRYYMNTINLISPGSWLLLGMSMICIGLIIYFNWFTVFSPGRKKTMLWFIFIVSLFSLIASVHGNQRRVDLSEVVLMQSHGLHISPDMASEKKEEMLPGQVLRITDKIGDWIKVKTQSFDVGWIQESTVKYITL